MEVWDRAAPYYDRVMRLFAGPMGRAIARTAEAVAGADEVLELAGGTGLVTAALAPRVGRLVATDGSPAMLRQLRIRLDGAANVTTEIADVYALRYADARFDAVVAANVLHLLPDLPGALAGMRRVLKPGGRLVVPTFCQGERRLAHTLAGVARKAGLPIRSRLTLVGLTAAVEVAGFVIERAELYPGLFPIGQVEARSGS